MSRWAMAVGLLSLFHSLLAQKSEVTCPPSFDWARNSKNQDPCLVVALLQADCRNDTNVTISKLAANEVYTGPDPANTNDVCACNTVVYSLLSVCAACQNRFFVDWTSWTLHCAVSYLKFPKNIPSYIIIPPWAFNHITGVQIIGFDMYRAISTAIATTNTMSSSSSPSFFGGSTQISTPFISSKFSTSQPLPASLGPTGSNPATDNIKSDHKRASIVGSVVGSVVALAVTAFGAFFLVRWCNRRRRTHPPHINATGFKHLEDTTMTQETVARERPYSFLFSPLQLEIPHIISNSASSNAHSGISLPSYVLHTSPDKEQLDSPALESSELFTTLGGHTTSESQNHYSDRQGSAGPNSSTSARTSSFTNRRGASRGSTLLSNLHRSPIQEEFRGHTEHDVPPSAAE